MKVYQKLVRDYIPEIIRRNGEQPVVRKLEWEEYLSCLRQKLQEEVNEYLESGEVEELADILEVVYALGKAQECSQEALENLRLQKQRERGGFSERLFLVSKE